MRLLVAHDGRDGGRDALELARVFAASDSNASALVVTVLNGGPVPMEHALLPEEEAGEAEAVLAEARDVLADLDVETRAYGGGSPAAILTTIAEGEELDAIVVGSPHRGAIGRVVLGSVGRSLLSGAPVDVAVAPAGYAQAAHEPLRDIAVGYDGAPESKLALQRAEALAKRSNAKIELVTVVVPPVATPVMVPGASAPESPPQPDKVINEGIHSIDSSLAAEPIRRDGDPAAQLLQVCEEGVDLLVVGSRGYGPLTRVLLGSVSRDVIRKAPCPVLAVRRQ
ncbi:MAG TPA: universal stress protein [Solirubrobacterales bacterium]|nr:universal stress protein [Solirubrobacterales bacterium]